MKTLPEVQSEVSKKISELRSIERIIHTPQFALVFNSIEDVEKIINDKCALMNFMQNKMKGEDDLSLRELRVLGKQLNVPKWFKLSKQVLLSEIENVRINQTLFN